MQQNSGASGGRLLRVHLLGGLSIEGVDARALGSRKARALLRRLAAEAGRPVGADELAATLWGDDPPRDPGDQLSVLVSRLRAVLGAGRLRRGDAGYRLVADWIDLDELRRRAAEAQARLDAGQPASALAAAQAALAIVRGRLLPEEDAAWAESARTAADREVARTRLLAAEAALALGDALAARSVAAAALDADPWDEAALRLLMRAEVAAGRKAAALVAYEALRARLADELGVDPAPETQALHLAVLQGRVPASPFLLAEPEIAGRREEIRRLDAALAHAARGEAVAVAVEGEPGIGKTALLRAWCARSSGTALIVTGRCDELGRDLPLQPVVDGLAAHLRGLGAEEAAAVLGDDRELLDGLLGRGGGAAAAAPVTTVADSAAGRLALFTALSAALERAARDRPLVVALDDLHQAAVGTLEFLAFVLRRLSRVAVVAARRSAGDGPELTWSDRIVVGPLSVEDAAALVGAERSRALHERSGGHPLFLLELARAPEYRLPASIVDAVGARVAALGDAARTVQAAAVLGLEVDVDLLAAVLETPLRSVLDDLERALTGGLLTAGGDVLAFRHALVRDAVEAATSPGRRRLLHRSAAALLAARPRADPLLVAGHARLAGEPAPAAAALVQAASLAAERFETATAESLLEEALALADTPAARLARGRLRLGRLDLAGARSDALRALELGAGAQAFELAGWVEYYWRDYEAARRYADEGAARAEDDSTRASCLALGGRVRHTRGELGAAADRLAGAVRLAPAAVRGVAQVWQAHLLVHTGRPKAGAETARRALLDPRVAHPFAPQHGRFALAMALALCGRWAEALEAVDDLESAAARAGDRRFPPIASNLRGWLLRGAGLIDEARELHGRAAEAARDPLFLEPHYAGLLDLGDDCLAVGDLAGAEVALGRCGGIVAWHGTMAWRHHARHSLLRARVALAGGDDATAEERAAGVAAAAADRGDVRYACRARLLAATACARGGRALDAEELERAAERFIPLAGPDGWRDLADLAGATRSDRWLRNAEKLAARVVAGARRREGIDADRVAAALRASLAARAR